MLTPFALSGVCLVTNVANPVPNLTRAQLQDLVAGRIEAWAQIPGSRARAIRSRRSRSTSPPAPAPSSCRSSSTSTRRSPTGRARSTTAAQVRDYVAATPAAWGYVDLAYTAGLHAVPYEGVPCTRETIVSGAYPARRPLGFVTRGAPRGALARFLRWIARDATARRVIATRYIVPYP